MTMMWPVVVVVEWSSCSPSKLADPSSNLASVQILELMARLFAQYLTIAKQLKFTP